MRIYTFLRQRMDIFLFGFCLLAPLPAQELLPVKRPSALLSPAVKSKTWTLMLKKHQYLRGEALQQGVDVVVRVMTRRISKVWDADVPNGDRGPELIRVLAARAGNVSFGSYRPAAVCPRGNVTVTVAAPVKASRKDRKRFEAEAKAAATLNWYDQLPEKRDYADIAPKLQTASDQFGLAQDFISRR